MKKIALPLLLFVATLNAQTFTGTGEAAISNITPEQAKLKAHEQAFLDILQQATGIEISSQQLVVNAQMASYHILQTHRARVVNSRCDYRIEPNPLTQIAICTGEVQAFGKQGPSVQTALLPLGNKNQCQFSASEFNAAESTEPMFKSGERFCLLIQP
ncbi:MAG: hypothetical protein QG652_1810, partial [Pseudomonadota bacterium]|nr:hypothetical protein [Pseudomonadota bacterium]